MSCLPANKWVLPNLLLLTLYLFFSSPTLKAQISADFQANLQAGCSPLTVVFSDQSMGPVTHWFWDFGNGNTSTNPNPGAIYIQPGTYTVTLIVSDGTHRDTLRRLAFITVFRDPIVNFSGQPTGGCIPLTTSFQDLSQPGDAPISQYLWDFGDGNLGSGANPNHIYTGPGRFDVTLVVTDSNGCSADILQPDLISTSARPNPILDIRSLNSCRMPISYQFDAQLNQPGNYSYRWDFGDGSFALGKANQHTYGVTGIYPISLQVQDSNGCQHTVTDSLQVSPQFPVASFNSLGQVFCAGQAVQFTNSSSGANSFYWEFGDGGSSNSFQASHTYALPGQYSVSLIATDTTAACGDTLRRIAYVDIKPSPQAYFVSPSPGGCQLPLAVQFTDSSQGATSYLWDFGDNTSANNANPIHVYNQTGYYDVSLVVANIFGCRDTLVQPNFAQVLPPAVDFLADTLEGCIPLKVDFFDLSTTAFDSITTWFWTFGDGASSFAQHPSHTYLQAGTYPVTLVVITANGCRDTLTYPHMIRAGDPVSAAFNPGAVLGCAGDSIAFTDLSGLGTGWQWFFGNGDTSFLQNPIIFFPDTGSFGVTQIVDNNGCRDTLLIPALIHIVGPVADFIMNPRQGCQAPLTVAFTDLSQQPGRWRWTFGDGASDSIQHPSHTYLNPGRYTVNLSVFDDSSHCSSSIDRVVNIDPIQASFSVNSNGGCVGTQVSFSNSSLNATRFFWDFGDGNSDTLANPVHQYLAPGLYTVRLIASNPQGCSDTLSRRGLIHIEGPFVDFRGDSLSGCAPLLVNFTDLSVANPSSSPLSNWVWDFGDGTFSTQQNPSHSYSQPGFYRVSLTVTDVNGCINTLSLPSFVQVTRLNANFSANQLGGCTGTSILFTNYSSGNGLSFLWDFGDGGSSTQANPSHQYLQAGTYTVSLSIRDQGGCSDVLIRSNFVTIQEPIARFNAAPTQKACPPLTVSFTDQSSADVVSWNWDFGDGSTSTLANPQKVYTLPGKFTVTLIVSGANGCTDTLIMPDLVDLSGPQGSFSFSPTQGCSPLDVTFISHSSNAVRWTWDFGDGNLGFGDTTSHTYITDTVARPVLLIEDSAGCVIALNSPDSLLILPGPTAAFTTQSPQVCLGQSLNFTSTSTSKDPIAFYQWDFGDGQSSALQHPQHHYTSPGTYQVQLHVSSLNGCVDSLNAPISLTVSPPPIARFRPSQIQGCAPLMVNFSDSSSHSYPIQQYRYDFGTGDSALTPFAPYTYSQPGLYLVNFWLEDSQGCRDSSSQTIMVDPVPVADFIASSQTGCAPKTIQFTDLSTGAVPVSSWLWDFGDGNSSSQRSPLHTYQQNGRYTVSLTITDANGCSDAELKIDYINLAAPVAGFSANTQNGCPPLSVNFSPSLNTGNPVVSYLWDFGDSTTSTLPNPSHVYTQQDSFTVSLIAITGQGCRDTVTMPYYIVTEAQPQAAFNLPDSICLPTSWLFIDSSLAGGHPITHWSWDFGNGNSAQVPNVNQTYSQSGTFQVRLAIQDAIGCTDTLVKNLHAFAPPLAAFGANDSTGCAQKTILFNDLSSGGNGLSSWQWDFGDGGSSNQQFPIYTYTQNGTYTVSLSVTDLNGCQDSVAKQSFIHLSPALVDFTLDQSSSCDSLSIAFTDLSIADTNITSWIWDFGDGTSSLLQNPHHVFTQPGRYTISLSITDAQGCVSSLSKQDTVQIFSSPSASFSISDSVGCAPLVVQFHDSSQAGTAPISNWAWSFGLNNPSPLPHPSRAFIHPGSYPVELHITDQHGCQDSLLQTITVVSPPLVAFRANDSLGCAQKTLTFFDMSTSGASLHHWWWDFGDGTTDSSQFPVHTYFNNGLYDVSLRVTDQFGCSDSLRKPQYIRLRPPSADFAIQQGTACSGLNVQFSDLSQADTNIISWQWSFGDGSISQLQHPQHAYNAPGLYTVRLLITDARGCSDQIVKVDSIRILAAPQARIALSDTLLCAPGLVNFADSSLRGTAPVSGWIWDFGNGQSSNQPFPSQIFTHAGTYSILLRIMDANGCQDSAHRFLQVMPPPTANFQASDTSGCAPEDIFFLDLSNGTFPISQWQWTFGDTSTGSSLAQPTHRYSQAGSYDVSLVVTDINGCTDSLFRPQYIHIGGLSADFSVDSSQSCRGLPVQFLDNSIADTTLSQWTWDFGDGQQGFGPNPYHAYSQAGQFMVRLIVQDILGCKDSIEKPSLITILPGPQALIDGPTEGCEPLLAQYLDLSSGNVSRQWHIDGTAAGLGASISRFFTQADSHRVRLVVIDSSGCTDTAYHSLVVHPLPQANFYSPDTLGCSPQISAFYDRSSSNVTDWVWHFGDGDTSRQQHPVHLYLQDGQYDVRLKVSSPFGCTDSLTRYDYIRASHPEAEILADWDQPCAPMLVNFTALLIHDTGIIDFRWFFGDGTSGQGSSLSHTYLQAGTYSISLILTDSLGCQDTVHKPDFIIVHPDISPDAPSIYHASVEHNDQIRLQFSSSKAADFDYYIVYREQNMGSGQFLPIAQLNQREDTVFTDIGLGTGGLDCRQQVYCYKVTAVNACGTESPLALARKHCTVETKATAIPDRMLINWTDYVGWDAVEFHEVYRVSSYDPGDAELLAVLPGFVNEYVDSSARCSNLYSYRIRSLGFEPLQIAWSDSSRAQNQRSTYSEVNQILRATVENNREVLVAWSPIRMPDLTSIILERKSDEQQNWATIALLHPGTDTYLDTDVAVGRQSYSYRISARDSCGFISAESNLGKSILLQKGPFDATHHLHWSSYEAWEAGVDFYEMEVYDDIAQQWMLVDIVPGDSNRLDVSSVYLDQAQYCFRVRAYESGGNQSTSLSNEVCIAVEADLYAPNAFSPNGDGINDEFFLKGVFIGDFDMKIYDRWGLKVFETRNLTDAWNGTFKGQGVPEGVYVFIARGVGYNGLEHHIKGSITLIR